MKNLMKNNIEDSGSLTKGVNQTIKNEGKE